MSYNTDLQSNNTELQEILDAVNALPEAETGDPALQSKSVTPTKAVQTVLPDSGYDGLSQVEVAEIPSEYIDTSDATAYSSHIMSGYTAYARGEKITGTRGTFTLPTDITGIVTGTITPASDYSGNTILYHQLGVVPDFVIIMLLDDISATTYGNGQLMQVGFQKAQQSGTPVNRCVVYVGSDGSTVQTYLSSLTSGDHINETTYNMRSASTYALKAGYTYRWIAGTVKDMA